MGTGPRLTVLGSLNMDISVTVPALPVPGATVLGDAAAYAPGGKGANQAVAAARLGGRVEMVGCLGNDDFGVRLRANLEAEGIGSRGVRVVPGAPSGLAMITVDAAGENIITVAPGANREVGTAEIAAARALPGGPPDVLVVSAEIPLPAVKEALAAFAAPRAGSGRAPLRVLNLAPAPRQAREILSAGVDWLVVNELEAAAVLGRAVAGLPAAAAAAACLTRLGARHAVVTAGAAGAAYCGPAHARGSGADAGQAGAGQVTEIPGFAVRAVDTVGAGDTFVGALAVALGAGVDAVAAVRAASAAGATAATRQGTQSGMPRPADVLSVTGLAWPLGKVDQ